MHARSTRNEGDECVGVLIVGLAYAEVMGTRTAREDRPTLRGALRYGPPVEAMGREEY